MLFPLAFVLIYAIMGEINEASHGAANAYWLFDKRTVKAMDNDTTPVKICTKCKRPFPATPEYFHWQKRGDRRELRPHCKQCVNEASRAYHEANKDAMHERHRKYQEANKDAITDRQRKYEQANKDKRRKYTQENRDKIAERHREYRKANKDKHRIEEHRRRARKRNLPDTFTVKQWSACLEYHNYCCAVCGSQLRDLFGNVPHADHWIAISNPECLGTTVDNMICLCSFCNLSKGDKLPDAWLIEKYGTRKANEILKRVAAYFEWASKRE